MKTVGGTVQWHTPIDGLMLGASDSYNVGSATTTLVTPSGNLTGIDNTRRYQIPFFFLQYDHKRVMFAGEYMRIPAHDDFVYTDGPSFPVDIDLRNWYVMTTFKAATKLTTGIFYSSNFDHRAALGPGRYQKDWALTARYDFNSFLYAKAEEHFLDGTSTGFSLSNNPNGLAPNSKLTILKIGVSF